MFEIDKQNKLKIILFLLSNYHYYYYLKSREIGHQTIIVVTHRAGTYNF